MRCLFLLSPLFLAACGADVKTACQNYFDAYTDCATAYADSAGVDPATVVPADTVCDAYEGVTDQTTADLLDCETAAYNDGDCTTADGWSAVATEVTACAGA